MQNKLQSSDGVTLVELLVVMVIGVIALMALVVPYVAERSFWHIGSYQAEAQRDADLVLRALTKMARQSQSYSVVTNKSGDITINFVSPGCGSVFFRGGTAYPTALSGGQFQWQDGCVSPATTVTLIDGVRSRVTDFSVTSVSTSLVKINLSVINQNQQTETLEKQIFLRNGS